jgi:hypothetical protein
MTNLEERLFVLDLAIAQLIAGILVTLGSTLVAISIGFGLSIPTSMQDAIFQFLAMRTTLPPEVEQALVQESLTNYVMILAFVGVVLVIIGVLFASTKINKIRRQIREHSDISDLLTTDILKKDTMVNHLDMEDRESVSNRITRSSTLSKEQNESQIN